MTLVAVIADTHLPRGSRVLARECVEVLARADLILHAGDVTAAPVLAMLQDFAPVHAVYGNMDEPELRATLPEQLVVETGGARIGMVHIPGPAAGRAARLAERFRGCDAVVYGHTHLPEATRYEGVWILNPGSPTERRRAAHRSLLTLEIAAGTITPRFFALL
jgi:putative phosphoesterase